MVEAFNTPLDRYHRHWPLALFAVMTWLGVVVRPPFEARTVLYFLATTALCGLLWLGQLRCRMAVGPSGIEERGWILVTRVAWDEIGSYRTQDDDELDEAPSEDLGDVLLWPLEQIFVRPVRWLLRLALYGRKPAAFFDRSLTLLDRRGKPLLEIDRSDYYLEKLEVMERIIAELTERDVRPHRTRAHVQ